MDNIQGPNIKDMQTKLVLNLKKLLQDSRITASKLSRETGVPTTTISNWLAGQSPKNIKQIYQVSRFFNVSIEELVFGVKPEIGGQNVLAKLDSEIKAGNFEVILRRIK